MINVNDNKAIIIQGAVKNLTSVIDGTQTNKNSFYSIELPTEQLDCIIMDSERYTQGIFVPLELLTDKEKYEKTLDITAMVGKFFIGGIQSKWTEYGHTSSWDNRCRSIDIFEHNKKEFTFYQTY